MTIAQNRNCMPARDVGPMEWALAPATTHHPDSLVVEIFANKGRIRK